MIHELKTLPQYFQAIDEDRKTFELRKNDRGFQAGDQLRLKEWNPEDAQVVDSHGYTRNELLVNVTYVLPVPGTDFVVMSIKFTDGS